MTQTFQHPLTLVEIHLDEQGIDELRLDSLTRPRSGQGETTPVDPRKTHHSFLPKKEWPKFAAALDAEWQRRHPARFLADRARLRRREAWLLFVWFPLLFASMAALRYRLVSGAVRHGASAQALYAKANFRLTFLAVALLVL